MSTTAPRRRRHLRRRDDLVALFLYSLALGRTHLSRRSSAIGRQLQQMGIEGPHSLSMEELLSAIRSLPSAGATPIERRRDQRRAQDRTIRGAPESAHPPAPQ
ncbi:MAG: hypothetical protein ACRENM_04000 [Candidatus Dormibacteraceae bacterium]